MRALQSHEVIDSMEGSACCLLCGTLEDPFVGCEHNAEILYRYIKEQTGAVELIRLDPREYPEITISCGCKFIDGTVTHMCDMHEDEMNKGFGNE